MTLYADAKLANIEGSLRQYVVNTLGTTFSSGAAIDVGGGEPFDDTAYSEWLQVRLLEPVRPATRWGPRGIDTLATTPPMARHVYYLLNLNIFVRPAKLSPPSSLRLQTLRDTVLAQVLPGTVVEVRDYAGSQAILGGVIVDDLDRDWLVLLPPQEQELLQWNIVVRFTWVERWLAP